MGVDQRRRFGVEIDHHRRQQRLPLDRAALPLALELLVDDALVRRVLVDDDDSVRGLGDDVVSMHLRPRGAERRGEVALIRRRGGTAPPRARVSAKLACAGSASRGAAGEARQSQRAV